MSLFVDYARSTDLYRSLCEVFSSDDGNLLEHTNDQIAEAQTEFLRWALNQAGPQVILETGTNKGMFVYFVSLVLRGVKIHTFDNNPASGRAVELINRMQKDVSAVFYPGDTRLTLKQANVGAQFAWIDGGHDADIPLNDLMQCFRLRIPFVAVDDTTYPSVNGAVKYMLENTPYKNLGNPFVEHDRRNALLLHLGDGSR